MIKKKGRHAKTAAAAPLGFLLPSVAVAACVAGTVLSYEPLVFDPSLFPQTSQAQAAPLASIDTSEVKKTSAAPTTGASYSAEDYAMDATGLVDGVYTGSAYGFKSSITVQVTVEDGKIASIVVVSQADDAEYFVRAKSVIGQVIARQTTAVDTVSGATYSSEGILMAVKNALSNAYRTGQEPEADADAGENEEAGADAPSTLPGIPNVPAGPDGEVHYLDGEYTACVICENTQRPEAFEPYYLTLTVVVKDGAVSDIKDVCGSATGLEGDVPLGPYDEENDDYLDRVLYGYTFRGTAYKGLLEQLLEDKAEPAAVNVVTSATYSSRSFAAAYAKALEASARAWQEAFGENAGAAGGGDAPSAPEGPDTDGETALPGAGSSETPETPNASAPGALPGSDGASASSGTLGTPASPEGGEQHA